MKSIIIFSIIILFISSLPLHSHGVNTEIINGGTGIRVVYDDLSPISFAETKIFSPENKEVPFQEGFTDKNGSFIFIPDRLGIWKIIVNDGLGHGVIKEIEIKDLKNLKTDNIKPISRWYKILTGLAFIFGITGIISYFHAKKLLKGVEKDAHS